MTQTQLGYGRLVARDFFSFLCSGGFTVVSDSALNLVFSLTLTDVAVTTYTSVAQGGCCIQ